MGLWLTYPKIPLQPLLKNLLNIDVINPGSPTNETRDMLDTEYARWLPPLAGPNSIGWTPQGTDWTTRALSEAEM